MHDQDHAPFSLPSLLIPLCAAYQKWPTEKRIIPVIMETINEASFSSCCISDMANRKVLSLFSMMVNY